MYLSNLHPGCNSVPSSSSRRFALSGAQAMPFSSERRHSGQATQAKGERKDVPDPENGAGFSRLDSLRQNRYRKQIGGVRRESAEFLEQAGRMKNSPVATGGEAGGRRSLRSTRREEQAVFKQSAPEARPNASAPKRKEVLHEDADSSGERQNFIPGSLNSNPTQFASSRPTQSNAQQFKSSSASEPESRRVLPHIIVGDKRPCEFGKYRFDSTEQFDRLKSKDCFIKVSGKPTNPLNWPRFLGHLFSGKPQHTIGMRPLFTEEREGGIGFVIDGFDDAASALQGSGISQKLAAALQALVFYPMIFPLVNLGAEGARGEFTEAQQDFRDSASLLADLKRKLISHADVLAPTADLRNAGSDAEFCRRLVATLEPVLASASPANRGVAEEYVRLITRFKEALDAHLVCRLKYVSTPAVLTGTHCMLAGMGLYQGAALTNLIGGAGSQAAGAALTGIGNVTMGVGQIAMAGYAAMQTGAGIKTHRQLQRQEKAIAASSLINKETKQDLLNLKAGQKKWNAIGKIGGNAGLSAGQTMMFLGGAAVGLGTPLLIAGTVVTIGSILVKLAAQKKYDRKFGYDAAAINDLKIQGACMLDDAVELLESERAQAMTSISWISLLSAAEQINAKYPDASPEEKLGHLRRTADGLHRDSHEQSLHRRMQAMLSDAGQQALLKACLTKPARGVARGVADYAALLMTTADVPVDEARQRIARFQAAPAAERIELMLGLLKEASLESEVMQDLTQRLVVKEHSRANRNGDKYKAFLDREKISRHRRLLWDKTKTVYAFRTNAFLDALRHPEKHPSPITNRIEENMYRAVQKAIGAGHAFRHRSRLLAANEMLTTIVGAEELRTLLAPKAKQAPVQDGLHRARQPVDPGRKRNEYQEQQA